MSEYGPDDHWFEHEGERLPMYYHMYNLTHLNERCVELAVARRFLTGRDVAAGIEVGNVMGHYWRAEHQIVDLNEPPAWYQTTHNYHNMDLFDLRGNSYMQDWLVSLSTIEHSANPAEAIGVLRGLAPEGLITFPTGVDPVLDNWVEEGMPFEQSKQHATACTIVREQNDHGGWVQTPLPQVRPYGPWANAVVILKWSAL